MNKTLKELKKIDSLCVDPIDYDELSIKILEVKTDFDVLYSRIPEDFKEELNIKTFIKKMMERYLFVRERWINHKKRIHTNNLPDGFNNNLTQYVQLDLRNLLLQVHEAYEKIAF